MYGCFVTPSDDNGSRARPPSSFISLVSRLPAATELYALANWAADPGWWQPIAGAFSIDVPSGRIGVQVAAAATAGRLRSASAMSPWVHQRGIRLPAPTGAVTVDVAFGGAFYAALPASALGLWVTPACLPQLWSRRAGSSKAQLDSAGAARHSTDDRLSGSTASSCMRIFRRGGLPGAAERDSLRRRPD